MDTIAILIPCYNESKTIEKVITDFKKELPDATIYVYDNNSTDDTAKIAKNAGAVVRHEPIQGKGAVVRRMFRDIEAKCYIMIDGDDTYPVEYVKQMADEVLYHNADMVVGDRLSSTYFQENKRRFHGFGNNIVRFFINRLFHSDIRDIMTGYRAFSYTFVKTFPVVSNGFEIETEMTIHAVHNNMLVKNVVVQYRDRPNGSKSKLHTFRDGFSVIKKIFSLFKDYKPLAFFGTISTILMLLAVGFFIPVFREYLKTGLVLRFPTLIICGFCGLSALLSLFAGLILQTIVNLNRQRFEFKLHEVSHWESREKMKNK